MRKAFRAMALILALLNAACVTSTPEAAETDKRKIAETNTSLGQGYMQRKQYEIALEKLKKAVAYDETYAPAHTVLAVLYETIGELDQADREYAAAVKYDPSDGNINNNYGAFLCRTGNRKEAGRYFQKALRDPFYQTPEVAYLNAGICSLEQGDLDKAAVFLRQSLQINDKMPSALISMADVSYQTEDFLRARAFLQRYGAVGTWNEDSLLLGYRIESKLGDAEMADRYRQELLERFPNSSQAGQITGQDQE